MYKKLVLFYPVRQIRNEYVAVQILVHVERKSVYVNILRYITQDCIFNFVAIMGSDK